MPSIPPWFAEVVVLARHFTQQGHLDTISQQLHLARGRAGIFDVIDFVAILLGYALSGEATLSAFFDRLLPFARPFMALFGRKELPHRATLSRFLADVDGPCRDALRQIFQDDLFRHGRSGDQMGGFFDCSGHHLLVVDVDGTRQAARQRALAVSTDLPTPQRRLDAVCAPGYTGRQRGEVLRTRTTILQAHTQQWLGTFSGPGNGDYATELETACQVIADYLAAQGLHPSQALIRLDGLYGTTSSLARIQPFKLGFLTRGRDYHLLDHPTVQARMQHPYDLIVTNPETQIQREVFDVGVIVDWLTERPEVVIPYRVILTRRLAPADRTSITIGKLRGAYVYELFLTSHLASSLSAATILALYQQRGAFEQVLSDEDDEQDPDRWCSHQPCGQEFWQILSQWVWNTRLRLGHVAQPQLMRWTTWESPPAPAPATPVARVPTADVAVPLPTSAIPTQVTADLVPTYGPLVLSQPWAKARRRFSSQAFTLGADDTLICPAGKVLRPRERRKLATGDLRVLYAAQVHDCRTCLQAGDCLGRGASGNQPRRISGVRKRVGWQVPITLAPDQLDSFAIHAVRQPQDGLELRTLQWSDSGGRRIRRDLVDHLRRQQVSITHQVARPAAPTSGAMLRLWTRAERAHRRLSWASRLARNVGTAAITSYSVTVCGIGPLLAAYLGLPSTPVP